MEIFALGRQAALIQATTDGATPRRIAESAKALWIEIDSALAPIIGTRGVNALFKRSVSLVGENLPWLRAAYEVTGNPSAVTVLAATLAQQSASSAASASSKLLEKFIELLANLIGEPLTARLLQPALEKFSNGGGVEDGVQ